MKSKSKKAGGGGWRGWLLLLGLLGVVTRAAEPAAPPPATEPQAQAVLTRWIEAIGGISALVKLRTQYCASELEFGPGGPKIPLVTRANHFQYRYDYEMPRYGRLTQAFDGSRAWQRNEELGFGPLPPADHAVNAQGVDFRAPLRAAGMPGWKRLPDAEVEGKTLQVLEIADANATVRWYFDPATGYRTRMEVEQGGGRMVVEFSDFRFVGGSAHREPHRIVRRAGGQTTVVTIRTLLYNEGLDPVLFAIPQAAEDENQRVEQILHHNMARAGAVALQQVRSRVVRQMIEIPTAGTKIPTTCYNLRPNLVLLEQDVPGMGKCWQGFDGQIGWAANELQGFRVMDGAELQQIMGTANLDGPVQLALMCPLRKLGEERQEEGRRLVAIDLANLGGPQGKAWFDLRSYDMVRLETIVQTGAQGQITVVVDFSDFRVVDGIRMPFRTVMVNPAMTSITTVESVKYNVELEPGFFAPKKEL